MLLARVLPVVAIISICFVYFVDLRTTLHYILLAIAIGLSFISVTWWWWVMFVMKDLHNSIIVSQEKFNHILEEIADIKKTIKNRKE